MLSKTRLNKYCNGDISLIANYYDALNDKNEIWVCHHILEQYYTLKELKKKNLYYNVNPEALIFIRKSEHQGNTKIHKGCKNRICVTDESKKKISAAHKGKVLTDNHKNNIAISLQGLNKKPIKYFGIEFFKKYNITYADNKKLYRKEYNYFIRNGKLRWKGDA